MSDDKCPRCGGPVERLAGESADERPARILGATNVTDQVFAEVKRATLKFPTWPTDPLHALAVLGEEHGELTKAMLQLTYEPHKTDANEVRTEAIQTAAMALRLAMSLDRYSYRQSPQHYQSEGDRLVGMHADDLPAAGMREDGLPD